MKLLEPAFMSFIRKKRLLLYIFCIAIMLGVIMVILNYREYLENFYNNEIENNIKNRTIFVSNNNYDNVDLDEITNLNNVEKCEYFFNTLNVNIYGKKYNLQSNILIDENKIIKGKNCESDDIEVVIPNSVENADNLLEKYINIEYNKSILSVKVVGIYNDDIRQNYCYISNGAIKELIKNDKNVINCSSCLVVIDQYKNLEYIIQLLKEKNLSANLYNTNGLNDIKTYKTVSIIFDLLIIIIFIFIYATLLIIVSNILNEEKKDIAILKALGYNQSHIIKIIFYRLLYIILISFGISFFIQIYLEKIFSFHLMKIINLEINYNLGLKLINYGILFVLLIFLIFIISLKNGKKVKLIDTIILLKE